LLVLLPSEEYGLELYCMAWNGTVGNPIPLSRRYRRRKFVVKEDIGYGRKILMNSPLLLHTGQADRLLEQFKQHI